MLDDDTDYVDEIPLILLESYVQTDRPPLPPPLSPRTRTRKKRDMVEDRRENKRLCPLHRYEAPHGMKGFDVSTYEKGAEAVYDLDMPLFLFVKSLELTRGEKLYAKFLVGDEESEKERYEGIKCSFSGCELDKTRKTLCKKHYNLYRCVCRKSVLCLN